MGKNLEELRDRNRLRKGQTKRDVDVLIDLAEQLHDALLNGGHSQSCDMVRRLDHAQSCTCGWDELIQSIDYNPVLRTRRRHVKERYGVDIPLSAIYEPKVTETYRQQFDTNALTRNQEIDAGSVSAQ